MYGETAPQGHSSKYDEVVAGRTRIGLNVVILLLSGNKIFKSVLTPKLSLCPLCDKKGFPHRSHYYRDRTRRDGAVVKEIKVMECPLHRSSRHCHWHCNHLINVVI